MCNHRHEGPCCRGLRAIRIQELWTNDSLGSTSVRNVIARGFNFQHNESIVQQGSLPLQFSPVTAAAQESSPQEPSAQTRLASAWSASEQRQTSGRRSGGDEKASFSSLGRPVRRHKIRAGCTAKACCLSCLGSAVLRRAVAYRANLPMPPEGVPGCGSVLHQQAVPARESNTG